MQKRLKDDGPSRRAINALCLSGCSFLHKLKNSTQRQKKTKKNAIAYLHERQTNALKVYQTRIREERWPSFVVL